MQSITIPAYAAPTLAESLTIEAPAEWHERINVLGRFTCYGPNYRRAVVETLRDLSHQVHGGYTALAYDSLVAAERFAGIAPR